PADWYDRYAAAIREEYGHVPDDAFRAGRAAVLRHLLDLPVLYRTPELRDRWQAAAPANLHRELDTLNRPVARRAWAGAGRWRRAARRSPGPVPARHRARSRPVPATPGCHSDRVRSRAGARRPSPRTREAPHRTRR